MRCIVVVCRLLLLGWVLLVWRLGLIPRSLLDCRCRVRGRCNLLGCLLLLWWRRLWSLCRRLRGRVLICIRPFVVLLLNVMVMWSGFVRVMGLFIRVGIVVLRRGLL